MISLKNLKIYLIAIVNKLVNLLNPIRICFDRILAKTGRFIAYIHHFLSKCIEGDLEKYLLKDLLFPQLPTKVYDPYHVPV